MDKRIWICPALCGCELEITAEWPADSLVIDGNGRKTSHMFPKGMVGKQGQEKQFIQSINVVNICPLHIGLDQTMPDTSGFFDMNNDDGALRQNRGYLLYPIANPTPGEILFTNLYGFLGRRQRSATCGCEMYNPVQTDQRRENVVELAHRKNPHLTKKCRHHLNDTDDHQACLAENAKLGQVLREILKSSTSLHEDLLDDKGEVVGRQFKTGKEPSFALDDARNITITLPASVKNSEKNTLSSAVVSKYSGVTIN